MDEGIREGRGLMRTLFLPVWFVTVALHHRAVSFCLSKANRLTPAKVCIRKWDVIRSRECLQSREINHGAAQMDVRQNIDRLSAVFFGIFQPAGQGGGAQSIHGNGANDMNTRFGLTARWLRAVAFLLLVGVEMASAAPALQGQVTLRPLTPQDMVTYGLTDLQGASGLSAVGVGQPAYFEALVNSAVTNADITNVTWTLTSKPNGSSATLLASPLGSHVPTSNMADRFNSSGAAVFKVAGRTLLRPDVTGQYAVSVTIQTSSSGSTNLTQKLTAGNYVGAETCALCHSGGILAPDKYHPWSQTAHASYFTKAIDGLKGTNYHAGRVPRHTVGFDTNAAAVNEGFDDVAAVLGWLFPTNLAPGNWSSMQSNYPSLTKLANVQCENCHGPGSEHAMALGNTNALNWPRIGTSYSVGNCAQCHDSLPNDMKVTEWNNSAHARATRTGAGPGRENCVRCHTAPGFQNFVVNVASGARYVTNTTYEAITCVACHDPHDGTNPNQLRAANSYTLPEGTTVTNVGLGALCMECHHSRNGEANQNIANYKLLKPTWAGGSSFGPHNSTSGDMVEGVNAITYGKVIPSGSHNAVIPDVCVGCHMQPVAVSHPAFGQAGGHTYSMTYKTVSGGVTNSADLVDACVKCHGQIQGFNFARKDYDGDGQIEGVQTEVQNLMNKLSRLLPNATYRADGNYVADGLVKSSVTVRTNWPTKFLQAAWNWQFVNVEGSRGVHNAPYAVGVLKASIADLTGDVNNDALPDSWQIQYFGNVNAPGASPNATPAGDGIPNWLKYALGLNPTVAGLVVPDGVVWASSSSIGGSTNRLHIYTAAEISFNSEVGRNYQIQAVSSLGGGWQNIGGAIAGTGQSVSYVTPTRSKERQFYRVIQNP